MKCVGDCWKCQLEECPYTLSVSSEIDREITKKELNSTELSRRRYLKSEKGKAALRRYYKSEKGKETLNRYAKSDKGRETNKRACRNYYLRHKAEILEKRKQA